MKIITPEEWVPSKEIKLEKAAQETIYSKSNILVVAGPGAGKTELLAQKAVYLFSTNQCMYPRKILAISFKKDAAENLKKRVLQRYTQDISNRFTSITYDAFAKNIVDRFRLALPEGNVPKENYLVNDFDVIEAAFQKENVYENNLTAKQFYDRILESINLPLQGNDLGERIWRRLLTGFGKYSACLSFKMISMLALHIIKINKILKKAMQITYSHIFLDEFQDTTTLQYNLIKECFLDSDCLITAVGDTKQRIMLWAGAKKNVFEDFRKEFNADYKCLTVNHRSAPRLIELQKLMYDSLNENNKQIIPSNKWNAADGEIKFFITNNNQVEEDILTKDIQKRILLGTLPKEICILCKQKTKDYTKGLIMKLSKKNIRARIEEEYQDLIKEPIIELILSIIKLSIDRKNPDDWSLLINELENLYGLVYSNQNNSYQKLQEELSAFLNDMHYEYLSRKEDLEIIVKQIINFLNINRIKAYFPTYSQGTYLEKKIHKFITLFNKELNIANLDYLKAIDGFLGLNSIPIMTIHKSKGLEYSSVYFIGLEDAAFWNFKNQPEEQRCAFFVALSRAKKSVIFTYCDYRNGFQYPQQQHRWTNEFLNLLQKPGIAEIIKP